MKRNLNLRHFTHLVAVCDCNFSVSRAANQLHVTQSVVSRNIQAVEAALRGPLFIRNGRRMVGMTPLCEAVIERVRDIYARVEDLHQVVNVVHNQPTRGEIRIACTHLQARYIMPQVLKLLRAQHQRVSFTLHQCFPQEINDMLVSNRVDMGICSEALADAQILHATEAYVWERVLLMPRSHKLTKVRSLSLARLAAEPTITYVPGITGRRAYDNVFARVGLHPNIITAAADSDVIKQFTREGLGVGVISCIAYDSKFDDDMVVRRLPSQFGSMTCSVVQRRDRCANDAKRLFVEIFCTEAARLAAASRALLL